MPLLECVLSVQAAAGAVLSVAAARVRLPMKAEGVSAAPSLGRVVMKVCTLVSGLLLAIVCTACTTRQGDFTVLSTRNVDIARIARARQLQNPVPVTGYDVQHRVLMIPVTGPPNLEEAVDDAMDRSNGDCMVDVVIYSYHWWIPFIYGQSGWKVKGRVLNTYGLQLPPE